MCSQHLLSIHNTCPDFQRHGTTAYSHSIHEKLKSNQSSSNIHIWFLSSAKQEYLILRRNEPLEQTWVAGHMQPLQANKPGNKADPWMLPQASPAVVAIPPFYWLKSGKEHNKSPPATGQQDHPCQMLVTHAPHTATSCLPCYHLHICYDSEFREF